VRNFVLPAAIREGLRCWDPRLDNSSIAVSGSDGTITLRDTVGSLRKKREAEKAAQRVYGVISVENQLKVKRMDDEQRADADCRATCSRRSCWTASSRRP
jgi:osmotically-inducible protein OsmY